MRPLYWTVRNSFWVLGLATFLALAGCGARPQNAVQPESVYERVNQAKKIRAGYIIYPPGSFKDPNSKRLYGIGIETLEEIGRRLQLPIEWTEEVAWGSMVEGLQTNRYDIIGNVVWANTTRGKLVDFSDSLFFSPIEVYVRPDDRQFDGKLGGIDAAGIKIATIDGEMSDIISRSQFPKANRLSLPQDAPVSQMLLNVSQHRADVAFVEPFTAEEFLKNNPGTLRRVPSDQPLRVFGNCFVFRRGQVEFKNMINIALAELTNSGYVGNLIRKYSPSGSLLEPAYPYRLSQAPAK